MTQLGEGYREVLAQHQRIVREAVQRNGGREVDTQGDAFFVVFEDADAALTTAVDIQLAHGFAEWPPDSALRVRIGLHHGDVIPAGELLVGVDVHKAARICAAGHGGQILVSAAAVARATATDGSPVLRPLGSHLLKDFPDPDPLFQAVIEGLPAEFPPLRVPTHLPRAAGLPDYSLPPADLPCPFKGLIAFEEEDRGLFFGREELVANLVARLEQDRVLAVVGPSGSGKSSLIRAGLLPALREGKSLRERWTSAVITPGRHPLRSLERAAPSSAQAGEIVLVVDQFEEVFTLCDDEQERAAFIDAVVAGPGGSAWAVVISLRADFYGHAASYPGLARMLETHQVLVGPMDEEELRRAIERPAEAVGLLLEPGLVEALIKDVAGQPGALPLLSQCLVETWNRRSDRLLTVVGYLHAGGVRGAVAKTAETVLRGFSEKEQVLARNIFLRLTELGDGTEDTRRRAAIDELVPRAADSGAVRHVLATLIAARLVIASEGTVEVAHEALIRHWPTLRAWLDEDREGRVLHRAIGEAAMEWRAHDRDESALYRGGRLSLAQQWARDHDSDLNDLEREFLTASDQAVVNELERARRGNRRLRILIAGLGILLLASVVAVAFALRQTGRAQVQTRVATSRALAGQSIAALEDRLDVALLLGLRAFSLEPTTEARNSVLSAIQRTRSMESIMHGPLADGRAIAFSPGGKWVAAGAADGTVVLWEVSTKREVASFTSPGSAAVTVLSFDPRSKFLAAGTGLGHIRLFSLEQRGVLRTWSAHRGGVAHLAFASDGARMVSASSFDGTVREWDTESGRPLGSPSSVRSAAFGDTRVSADGKTVATMTAAGSVLLFDRSSGSGVARVGASHRITRIALSPDGTHLALGTARGRVELWDTSRRLPTRRSALRLGDEEVTALAFDAEGERLGAGARDGRVRIWDGASGGELGGSVSGHVDAVSSIAFASDGMAVSGGVDGSVILWSAARNDRIERDVVMKRANEIAVSPQGDLVAVAGVHGKIDLVRLADGRLLEDSLKGPGGSVIDFFPGGSILASGGAGGAVTLWDVATLRRIGKPIHTFSEILVAVAVSPDGKIIATGDDIGAILLLDVEKRTPIGSPIGAHASRVSEVDFSPGGETLVTAGRDGVVRLWDVPSGAPIGSSFDGHGSSVLSVSYSPDGGSIASAGEDGTVLVWDARSQRVLLDLQSHDIPYQVVFSPDGSVVAAGGRFGLELWDATTGARLGEGIEMGKSGLWRTEFTRSGEVLVAAGERSITAWDHVLWSSDKRVLYARVCHLVRDLSKQEWSLFVPDEPYRPLCSD